VVHALRDPKILEKKVQDLKNRDGYTDLVQFFEAELLGSMREKYQQFVIGLRAQLENITSNRYLKQIMQGHSDIDIDVHFEQGGVLAVSTSLGKLRKAGDAFGQFVIMHLQSGTFRRKGTEQTRVPHYMIVDEYSRYINPDVELFLSIAAEYRVAGVFAIQSLGQLEVEAGKIGPKAMKQAILTSCRNKIAFGGLSAADAKEFSDEFGKEWVVKKEKTYDGVLIPRILPKSYRIVEKEINRFYYTDLMDGLPRFHYVHKLLQDGTPQPPGLAKGTFVPKDWKEQLINHQKKSFDLKIILKFFKRNEKLSAQMDTTANNTVEENEERDNLQLLCHSEKEQQHQREESDNRVIRAPRFVSKRKKNPEPTNQEELTQEKEETPLIIGNEQVEKPVVNSATQKDQDKQPQNKASLNDTKSFWGND
jgi:hypothetical protein